MNNDKKLQNKIVNKLSNSYNLIINESIAVMKRNLFKKSESNSNIPFFIVFQVMALSTEHNEELVCYRAPITIICEDRLRLN